MNDQTKLETEFCQPAILELMGHRRLAGLVQSVELAGAKFLRIDVPDAYGKLTTQFYSPSSVYCLTPTTEEIVQRMSAMNQHAPVHRYELSGPLEVEDRCDTSPDEECDDADNS